MKMFSFEKKTEVNIKDLKFLQLEYTTEEIGDLSCIGVPGNLDFNLSG